MFQDVLGEQICKPFSFDPNCIPVDQIKCNSNLEKWYTIHGAVFSLKFGIESLIVKSFFSCNAT